MVNHSQRYTVWSCQWAPTNTATVRIELCLIQRRLFCSNCFIWSEKLSTISIQTSAILYAWCGQGKMSANPLKTKCRRHFCACICITGTKKRRAHWSSHSFKFNLILIKFLWRKGKSTAATRKPKNVTHMLHRLFNSFVPCRAFIYVAYVFFVNIRCGRCFSLHSKTPNPKFTLSFQLCV